MIRSLTRPLLTGLFTVSALLPAQRFSAVPGEAGWTVSGKDFLARFDSHGARFSNHTGASLRFALQALHCGADEIRLAAPVLSRAESLVAFDRGEVVEEYLVSGEGMEQRFRIDRLAARGELRLRLAVDTELVPRRDGDAIRFSGPRGEIAYGAATAIDAAGNRIAMDTAIIGGGLELVVPARFVAVAVLPLVVDPVVHATQTWFQSIVAADEVDFAYDPGTEQWLAVFQVNVGTGQWSLFGRVLDASGAPVGEVFGILQSLVTSWKKPRIARLAATGTFLLVAEVVEGANPSWIGGRIMTLSGTTVALSEPFVICKGGVRGAIAGAYRNPDVGGDGNTGLGGRWTVVFEHSEPGDLDIHLRQVGSDGSILGAAPTPIAATAYSESNPRISRSNGAGAVATQTWPVVYERAVAVGAGTIATRLWMAMVNPGGSLRTFLGSQTWQISDHASSSRKGFDVSSPTDDLGNSRWFSVVEARLTATQGQDLYAFVFDHLGLGPAPVNLTALENGPSAWQASDQWNPAVDSDGTRFTVAYSHLYSAFDSDVHATTFARLPNGTLVVHDARVAVAATTGPEVGPVICARRSGSGLPGRSLIGHGLDNGVETFLRARLYEGLAPGGFTWRSTGCGGLAMTVAGTAGLGMPIRFELPTAIGPAGFFIGAPAAVPLAICPGCTLGTTAWTTASGNVWTHPIPNVVGLVGATLAMQGFEAMPGAPCLDAIRLAHTVDFVVR